MLHIAIAYGLLGIGLEIAHPDGLRVIGGAALMTGVVVTICVTWLAWRLRQSAAVDALTGLVNGRSWRETLDRELLRSERTGAALSALYRGRRYIGVSCQK